MLPVGEIDTIDNGAFGAVTITKSISIIGMGPGQSGVLQVAGSGFIINAGPTDVVRIEGEVLGMEPPSGDRVRQRRAKQVGTGCQRPPQQAAFALGQIR